MRSFKITEIKNKHGQYIAYIVNIVGITELERFEKLHNLMNNKFTKHIFIDKSNNNIYCLCSDTLQIFNQLGELIDTINDEIYDKTYANNIQYLNNILIEFNHL